MLTIKTFIIVNANYAGSRTDAAQLLAPLLDLSPKSLNVTSLPWADLLVAPGYGIVTGTCDPVGETVFGVNLRTLGVANIVNVTNFITKTQAASTLLAKSLISITMPGKAIGMGPGRERNASAFPWRSVTGFLQVEGRVPQDGDGPAVEGWAKEVRAVAQAGSGYGTLGAYVNTAQGDEGNEGWYSAERLPHLRSLKTMYDPYGLFDFYAPIDRRGSG